MFSLMRIMPPRVRTRSAGRPIAESRGGGTGERVGRGGRGRGPRGGNDERVDELNGQGNDQNLFPAMLAQVGNQGNVGNQNNKNVQEDVRNVLVNENWVGPALKWWNSQIRTLSQEVVVSMSWNDFKLMMIEEFCPSHEMQKLDPELWIRHGQGWHAAISGALTDEVVRNESIKKVEKQGNVGEPSKDKNVREDNKRTRTGNAFATIANPVGRGRNMVLGPNGTAGNCRPLHRRARVRTCFKLVTPKSSLGGTCRVVLEIPGGNRPNQVAANNGGQGRGNQGNQARGRAFILGAEEARQDPNIVTEDVEPKQIILDPDDQPMWESAKTVAPTPNSAIIQLDDDDNFDINSTHLNMIRENKFDGYLRADPHDHIREFLAICNMFIYGETQSEAVKLLIFLFSLCDEAKTWFNELNEESITSWEQMRKVFINIFFPPSLFNRLLLEIRNFSQLVCKSLIDAWLQLKSMLRK
ncbi:reverse transcriptase domain-containing protein [Tanacetum coccineum]